MGPPDPILGITVAFRKDTHPKKQNLGVGAYRDDQGKPFVLSCVKDAEKKLLEGTPNHEYGPIGGEPAFTSLSAELLFGKDCKPLQEKRIASIQTLSGTGALRVAAEFFNRFLPQKEIYFPNPTWGNHNTIFEDSHFKSKAYKYYDGKGGLDFQGMKADIEAAPSGSLFCFHACAHNPTGVDPNQAQWTELSKVVKAKGHYVLFDSAYQGFASGDPVRDAFAVRQFIKDGHEVAVCQSFAKNFGLYGERVGAFHVVSESEQKKEELLSQLLILVRPMYSNPPIYGSKVIQAILEDPKLKETWHKEVKVMADRIINMRQLLVKNLKDVGSKRDWSHITNQIGMFCYSGLSPEQVDKLKDEYHVYMTRNGRISMAGVTSSTVRYLAESIHAVSK
jgi:aspartate aminotransferase